MKIADELTHSTLCCWSSPAASEQSIANFSKNEHWRREHIRSKSLRRKNVGPLKLFTYGSKRERFGAESIGEPQDFVPA
jgi:hypothetical protein